MKVKICANKNIYDAQSHSDAKAEAENMTLFKRMFKGRRKIKDAEKN